MSIRRGDNLADVPDPREALELHRKRKLSAFMRAPDPGNSSDTKIWDAFWTLVYDGSPSVDYETADAVVRELSKSDRTVGDVIDGFRPSVLSPRETP